MSFVDPKSGHTAPVLRETDVDRDPLVQFRLWYDQALGAGIRQPEAMTLATATRDGQPAARMVLLRGYDERGFVFYTNYDSRKGRELTDNPRAALVLYWSELDRQIRIEGRVERTSPAESDAYFASRPAGSQLGAWASPQSEVIANREVLELSSREHENTFRAGPVPRPSHWGGFRVVPDVIEFWQGQPNRLHDRLRYRRTQGSEWNLERLAP